MSDGPAAGWYPDPEDATQQRYWDGSQWTEHRAPLSGATPPGDTGGTPQDQGTSGTSWPTPPSQPGWPTPQAGGGPGYGQYPQAGGVPAQNQKAVWALVLGILGLVCCGLVAGIPAIIIGNQAKREIAASGGRQSGQGLAQGGVICGIIATVLSVIGLLVYALVFAGAVVTGF